MSLNWNVENVQDFESVCYVEDENGDRKLSVITDSLIWFSMWCGFGRITEDNAVEIKRRIDDLAELGEGRIVYHDGERWQRRAVTLDEVRAHIGLRTNASKKSVRTWNAEIKKLREQAERRA